MLSQGNGHAGNGKNINRKIIRVFGGPWPLSILQTVFILQTEPVIKIMNLIFSVGSLFREHYPSFYCMEYFNDNIIKRNIQTNIYQNIIGMSTFSNFLSNNDMLLF